MKLKNGFRPEDRLYFHDVWKCWWCEMNTADSLHHIHGRGSSNSDVENSILNAAPMCNQKCHIKNHGKIQTYEWKKIFTQKTFDYLLDQGYKLSKKDREFIKKYEEYYRRDQLVLARKSFNQQDIQRDALEPEDQPKEPISHVNAPIKKQAKIQRKRLSS